MTSHHESFYIMNECAPDQALLLLGQIGAAPLRLDDEDNDADEQRGADDRADNNTGDRPCSHIYNC